LPAGGQSVPGRPALWQGGRDTGEVAGGAVPAVAVFDERVCRLGEGPYYDDRSDRAGWVDILGRTVRWRELAGNGAGELAVADHVGAAVPRRGGGLVLCLPAGPTLLDPDGSVHPLGSYAEADAEAERAAGPWVRPAAAAGQPPRRSNDAKADPAGRLWLGTMAYAETPGAAALYRLDPGAAGPTRVLGGVTISNGLGWSPDATTMYYVDTPTGRVDRFDYDLGTGLPSGRRPFATVDPADGAPDGLCVDADGGVWVALWGGSAVRRYTPAGRLDRVVALPTPQVTSCAFAGPDYRLLLITTAAAGRPAADTAAGLTYRYEPGDVAGRPVDRFAG
jgi:sugar lactone lactonase YvrE